MFDERYGFMNAGSLSRYLEKLAPLLFIGSLCFFSFAFGVIAFKFKVFPYSVLQQGIAEFKELTTDEFTLKRHPVRYDESGVIIRDLEQIMPGSTLISAHWPETDWGPGIRLIDVNGETLNHWVIKPQEIWSEPPHEDLARNPSNYAENYVHGMYLFPNGDIVFSVEFLGLTRMNSCGELIWNLPYRTHHSVYRADTGNFWVSGFRWIEAGDERVASFPDLTVPFGEETVLEVSPEGEVLREISLLESFYNSGYKDVLWHFKLKPDDILHLNDVEVLGDKIADQYPLFEAGDIVVSMKRINRIAVIDPKGTIKWMNSDNLTHQHDPDFEEDGWITVFDNREFLPGPKPGTGASVIRSINPASGEIRDLYGTDGDKQFFTPYMGKHQKLENGNRLITEATAGRVFEISPAGETVWEWISEPLKDDFVLEVTEGTRYDIDAQQVAAWKCSGPP